MAWGAWAVLLAAVPAAPEDGVSSSWSLFVRHTGRLCSGHGDSRRRTWGALRAESYTRVASWHGWRRLGWAQAEWNVHAVVAV